jgi:3',5'-cyclic AMP phosphodiesterase CpdA
VGVFLRLLHVSDLHFGDSPSAPWWVKLTWIPGLETHSERIATELSNSVRLERINSSVPIASIATGDLTTWGRPAAFSVAFDFLRGKILTGGKKTWWLGLNDPNVPIVPGNHDIWGGAILGLSLLAGLPPSARPDFDLYFKKPAPKARYTNSGVSYPYWLRYDGPPAVYIYGLDSNRVDEAPNPLLRNLLADGFVDQQQLDDLQKLVSLEIDEPRIRIAAIHHPLAYAKLTGTPQYWKTLINIEEVIRTLQSLGFAIVLCGHEHKGFVRSNSAPNVPYPPIQVFSVGASTQSFSLSHKEEKLISQPRDSVKDPAEQKLWDRIAMKCSEFRIYDFESIQQGNNQSLEVTVNAYRYDPGKFAFVQKDPISLPFTSYVIGAKP